MSKSCATGGKQQTNRETNRKEGRSTSLGFVARRYLVISKTRLNRRAWLQWYLITSTKRKMNSSWPRSAPINQQLRYMRTYITTLQCIWTTPETHTSAHDTTSIRSASENFIGSVGGLFLFLLAKIWLRPIVDSFWGDATQGPEGPLFGAGGNTPFLFFLFVFSSARRDISLFSYCEKTVLNLWSHCCCNQAMRLSRTQYIPDAPPLSPHLVLTNSLIIVREGRKRFRQKNYGLAFWKESMTNRA